MAGLLQAQEMQTRLLTAQQEIAATTVTGTAGNGLVTITGNGTGDVTAVTISPEVVSADDVETLQDLIIGALADLAQRRDALTAEKMGPLAGGLGGPAGGISGGGTAGFDAGFGPGPDPSLRGPDGTINLG